MTKIKLALAIFFSKLTYFVFKLCGRNASHSPGVVALKICPDYFAAVKKPPLTICVTGTNGKTTCTNMVSDVLEANGLKVATNRLGSNIAPGCATALTNSVNLFGKPKCDALVLEVDERASRLILPYLKPDYLAVTNLFRDSLMRNANPDYIFSIHSRKHKAHTECGRHFFVAAQTPKRKSVFRHSEAGLGLHRLRKLGDGFLFLP